MTYRQILTNIIIIFLLIVFIKCTERNSEKEYFENGNLKYEVTLKGGLREGLLTEYYENGNIYSKSMWKQGKLNGPTKIYYKNKSLRQESQYKDGSIVGVSKIYSEDGKLKEKQFFDSLGNLVDYTKFLSNGDKNNSIESKKPIFIGNKDTVSIGEKIELKVLLGNQEFNSIEVHLGKLMDRKILYTPKMPKLNDTTVLLSIKAKQFGENTIEGVIVDIDKIDRKNFDVIPFSYSFYVRPR